MLRTFTDAEARRHDELFEEASRLVKGEFPLDGQRELPSPGFRTKWKLKRASGLFEKVLELNPDNKAAVYCLARIQLRFGDKERALDYLLKAEQLDPTSPGFAREVIVLSLELGRFNRAAELGIAAVQRIPNDGGLFVNLGLAHLLAGNPSEAESTFRKAQLLEPEHPVTPRLVALTAKVASGESPHPRSLSQISRALTKP